MSEHDVAILGVGMHPWGKWGNDFTEYGMVAARRALARRQLPLHFGRQAAPGPAAPGVGLVPRQHRRRLAGRRTNELAEALHTLAPKARLLYTSGYTDDAVLRHGIQHADVAFLRKPYTPIKLARKIRELFDPD